MPIVSMFYGIIIQMFFYDTERHHLPHIHVRYQDAKAVMDIEEGNILEGSLPQKQLRLVQAWIELNKEALYANWELAATGQEIFRIQPL